MPSLPLEKIQSILDANHSPSRQLVTKKGKKKPKSTSRKKKSDANSFTENTETTQNEEDLFNNVLSARKLLNKKD